MNKARSSSIVAIVDTTLDGKTVTMTGIYHEEARKPIRDWDDFERMVNESIDPDTPISVLERAKQWANEVLAYDKATVEAIADANRLITLVKRIRKKGTFSFLAGVQLGQLSEQLRVRTVEPYALEGLHQYRNRQRAGDTQKKTVKEMRRQLREWDKMLKGRGKKAMAMRQLGIPKSTYYKYKAAVKKS